ncbi:hypothetical protein B0A55_01437 [Friedmanniomyces simplex]|uniref:DUF7918 domain-containing protein n=1 Tax=Friedmanniomyces simplex TaxID=329884 RepID=A0A4U0Y1S4_9PEZI|nr:hypothetical protein B0A55_01437 [Friedmanniomyces simplex]
MAIHPCLPGMVVNVNVDHQNLPEHDDDEATDGTYPTACVKYIEAITGARFHIAFRFDAEIFPYVDSNVSVEVTLDCGAGSETYCEPRHIRQPSCKLIEWAVRGTKNGLVKQAMVFSELTISEDLAPDKSLIGKLAALGTIRVEVYKADLEPRVPSRRPAVHSVPGQAKKRSGRWRGKDRGKGKVGHPASMVDGEPTPLIPDGRVSEKVLKGTALTHQATVGPAIPYVNYNTTQSVHTGRPLAIFLFKYRSRAALQALHLIPRTPSPVPLEDRPVEELTIDDMRELIRRQRVIAKASIHLRDPEANGHSISQVKGSAAAETKVKTEVKREREALVDESDGSDVELRYGAGSLWL